MADLSGDITTRSMTASEVQAVIFNETRRLTRGYDEDEVDDFIDRVALAVQTLNDRITQLEAENTQLREEHDLTLSARSATILDAARRTADDTMSEADEYSLRVVGEAQVVRDKAAAAAQQIVKQARVDSAAALASQHAGLEQQITHLAQIRDTTQADIRTFIQSLVDRLNRTEDVE